MLKAYKFRIYPTKSQRTKMERTLVHLGLNKSNFRCREPFLDMSI
ncbi:MAG: helix-turn-helix domain-containing protein [Methanothrix sp.]|nr:helix-turn-helix domain-containing protein [Methanothrix sp.]MCK9406668.1 helix-turn-helix domain-containing protein [Methanothrix sp.]